MDGIGWISMTMSERILIMVKQAQVKVASQAKKYKKVNRDKGEKIHLLSGILKYPVCGSGMYGNKAIKKRKDGSN